MRLILKVVVVFAVVALLLLGLFSYLEKREGDMTASAILEDIKDAGMEAGETVTDFLEKSGIKEGAANLMEKGANLLKNSPVPEESPDYSPLSE